MKYFIKCCIEISELTGKKNYPKFIVIFFSMSIKYENLKVTIEHKAKFFTD